MFLNGYKNKKKSPAGAHERKSCKTHFSPGQLKLQVSPPWVSAPSDSPFISPQSDLSKSADLIMPCSNYKALTFSCSSRIKAHLPRPAGEPPPGPCHSPPGPLRLCAGTRELGAILHPSSILSRFWAFPHCLLCSFSLV